MVFLSKRDQLPLIQYYAHQIICKKKEETIRAKDGVLAWCRFLYTYGPYQVNVK